jgi:hypothetical protein
MVGDTRSDGTCDVEVEEQSTVQPRVMKRPWMMREVCSAPSTGNSLGGVDDGDVEMKKMAGWRDGSCDHQRQAIEIREIRTLDDDNELYKRCRDWHITLLYNSRSRCDTDRHEFVH